MFELTLSPFVQFSIFITVVLGISGLMKVLRQPLIIGYILSGIILGPFLLDILKEKETIQTFSEMGIAFLLFIVGLGLSPNIIKEVGKISLVTGIGQIVFTSIIGFLLGIILGFNIVTSIYISIALTFSSTIIIMKLLSDKDALDKTYGKISVGFLLVQDFIAILILIILSALSGGKNAEIEIIITIIKGVIFAATLIPFSMYILPKIIDFFAKSQETLFLFGIAWGLGLGSLFYVAGFSIEVGSLIAGITLSISPYSLEISSKLKPLRDFFIIYFFIMLGSQMVFNEIPKIIFPALVFSIFVLIGNPIIVMTLMKYFGYNIKTSYMSGLTVAQISEFSLILITMGVNSGQLKPEIMSFVTLIGIITIGGSTYMIMFSDQIFEKIKFLLKIFEPTNQNNINLKSKRIDYVLIGYNRIGFSILRSFKKITKKFLVIDYDPEIIKFLKHKKIDCIFGDASNIELLNDIDLKKSKFILSTIPDIEINLMIINHIKTSKKKPIFISTARQIKDAKKLYNEGVDYVIMPHFLGGEYIANIIEKAESNKNIYKIERIKDIKNLNERLEIGHEHPNNPK